MSKDWEKDWPTIDWDSIPKWGTFDPTDWAPPEMSKEMRAWIYEAINDLMEGELREELEWTDVEKFAIKIWEKARAK